MRSKATAALVGAVLGLVSAVVSFAGSGVVLAPWVLAGAAVGWIAPGRRQAPMAGALYGLALTAAFLVTGYDGRAGVVTFVAFVLGFGAFGATCGCVLAVVGATVRRSWAAHAPH